MKGRKTYKTKRGGRKIGEGVFGQVFHPPLLCKDGSDTKWQSLNYISKTIYKAASEQELHNTLLVKELDPHGEWSITAEHICEIANTQTNENYKSDERNEQIVFRFGGVSLDTLLLKPGSSGESQHLMNRINNHGEKDTRTFELLHPEGLSILVEQVKRIIPKLDILNKRYSHGDMHLKNIVTDGANPKLIDFDSLRSVEELYKEEKELMFNCLKLKPNCSWLTERLENCVLDSVRSGDIKRLWSSLINIFESEWVKETFRGKYDTWLKSIASMKDKQCFRSDYVLSILEIPS